MNIEKIKRNRNNRIFFGNASFHGDSEYEVYYSKEYGSWVLRVKTKLTGWVEYIVDGRGEIGRCVSSNN